ncbi:MAG TPA: helix-turn-helix domain-containing protein [Thermomicrobiales bacterium]
MVRSLTDAERQALEAGLRSSAAFTVRRAQVLLASARGEHVPAIARTLGCDEQTVRNALHAFAAHGLAALTPGSSRPHTTHAVFDAAGAERLTDLLHRSPRDFGHPTSLWTLELAAQTAHAEGLTPTRVTGETVRATLARHKVHWQRAKRWITSPDPAYQRKKRLRDRLIRLTRTHPTWALGFADEVWWSRVAQPAVRAWTATGQPLRLVEQAVAKGEPKAVACYGLLVRWWDDPAPDDDPSEALWLRFVDGRPISGVTTRYLAWSCAKLAAAGRTALLLVWDNASWHVSREVEQWIAAHNAAAKAGAATVRIVACPLPIKSPWLNPIEPKWVHGKRRVVEPARLLTMDELEARVYDALGADHADHLAMPEKAA